LASFRGAAAADLRCAGAGDLKAIRAIYGHRVLYGLASCEKKWPGLTEIARRCAAVVALGLPYLLAEWVGVVAYAGPFRPRPAYRHTVENMIYVAHAAAGLGLGRLLLGALIKYCSAGGCRWMVAGIGDP